jgi:hypothetical protein
MLPTLLCTCFEIVQPADCRGKCICTTVRRSGTSLRVPIDNLFKQPKPFMQPRSSSIERLVPITTPPPRTHALAVIAQNAHSALCAFIADSALANHPPQHPHSSYPRRRRAGNERLVYHAELALQLLHLLPLRLELPLPLAQRLARLYVAFLLTAFYSVCSIVSYFTQAASGGHLMMHDSSGFEGLEALLSG